MVVKSDICFECGKKLRENEYFKYKIWYGNLHPVCYCCWLEIMGIKDATHGNEVIK